MAPFKFGIFYFRDKSVHVESADIVTPQYTKQLVQVLARPDLSNDDGWIEVYQANRKEPQKKVAAKLLLLGDNYKVLIEKKKAFLRNEDIWIMAAEKRGAAQCTTSVDGSKPKKTKNAETLRSRIPSESDDTDIGTTVSGTIKRKRTKTATERVLSQLKSSLLNRKPTTSTPSHSEEDDPDIDTNVDLFDPPQTSGLTNLCHGASEEESVQGGPSLTNVHMHQEVMEALKEIPTLVKCVKELITTMKRMPPAIDTDGTDGSGSSSPAPEMIFLGNTRVQVSKSCFRRLNRTRMTLFAQELAVLLFGRDVLASSSLTGKSALGTPKDHLDPEKLSALVGMYF
ncbi:hypothetical protein MHYP_G00139450 [Metynnis hypsauchen]